MTKRGTTLQVPLHQVDPTLPAPAYARAGCAGFDLSARQTCVIGSQTTALVPLGVIIKVPDDHVLLLAVRSSLLRRKGLMCGNGVGVVDPSYCGPEDEVCLLAYNVGSVPVTVERGERIAQGLVLPLPTVEFVPYTPEGPSRGGFGATGTGLPD